MTMRSQVEFSTFEFEFAHGRLPRGRGSWGFALDRDFSIEDVMWVPGVLTYAEACREVRRVARMFGFSGTVVVCS
jgi:hypothetical protein